MAEAVKVIVRCRPLNTREKNLKCENIVQMDSSIGQCRLQKPGEKNSAPKAFTFDGVFFTDSITENIYSDICFPLVEGCVEGYNGTVFAYGQTGCGKSFTMQGIEDPPTQRGIIPRAFEHIFESIGVADNTKFLVHASYLEIYNEDIRDLLSKDHKNKLDVKEHPDRGVYVKDLSMIPCHNVKDMEKVMEKGGQNRSVGATLMNADSSRSHSIFTIFVETCETGPDGQEHIRAGKLNLVDLAGSERQAKTGASGDRLKEATKINLSLSALGNVISALVDGKAKHIPYRDSKLTRLLQDSLGGNTKTLMVACISPADNNYDETLSTLRYANRAKNIKNKPKINEDPKDALLRQFQDEITLLKQMLMGQIPMTPEMLGKLGLSDAPTATIVPAAAPAQPAVGGTAAPTLEATASNEEEANRIREEYEDKLKQMQKMFEEEQVNKQRLEEEISKLQEERDKKIQEAKEHQPEVSADFLPLDRSGGVIEDIEPTKPQVQSPKPNVDATTQQNVENLAARLQNEAMQKLDVLQKQLVGGEKKENLELKKKHKKRKEYASEREKKMIQDIKKWEGERIMVKVYDNLQEEIKLKAEDISKLEKALESSNVEVSDLQSEFEAERSDYLDTIRKMERQLQLQSQILQKVQPLIRRDCNYSNVDRMKVLAEYDEENQRWKIPEIQVEKITLPKAGSTAIDSQLSNGKITGSETTMVDYYQRDEVDRYAQRIQNNNNEQFSNAYFKPKRAEKLLTASPSNSLNLGHSPSTNLNSLTKLQPLGSPAQQQDTMMARRPQKLEALPASAFDKKKKKNKNREAFP